MRLEIRTAAHAAFYLYAAVAFSGCATQKPNTDMALIQKIQVLEASNRDLKEKAIIARGQTFAPVKKVQEPDPIPFNDEHTLYQAALDAFWKKDSKKLKRVSSIFSKTFPKSPLADNVLYLKGSLDFSLDDVRGALETLNQLVEDYPLSNKRVSADFLRAILFSRLNLNEQSQETFARIVRQYPGSFEARQAKLQLRQSGESAGKSAEKSAGKPAAKSAVKPAVEPAVEPTVQR